MRYCLNILCRMHLNLWGGDSAGVAKRHHFESESMTRLREPKNLRSPQAEYARMPCPTSQTSYAVSSVLRHIAPLGWMTSASPSLLERPLTLKLVYFRMLDLCFSLMICMRDIVE